MNLTNDYKSWLTELKQKIRSSQIKAAVAVNSALIEFYWELGKMINQKLQQSNWGDKILEQVSKDLMQEFTDMKGLSTRNLKYCRFFYEFYSSQLLNIVNDKLPIVENVKLPIRQQPVAQIQNTENDAITFVQQPVAQIPWGHHILIFTKIKNQKEALFYIQKTIENNWSRNVLDLQIKSDLYNRQGKAISNFKYTLPEPLSDLAQQTLKDPYIFDFIALTESYKEKDIEKQLVKHITQFLLELGKGFAFVGKQYHVEVANKDYYIDLLFYHIKLKCYVVIELKNTEFMPEYTGKLNFYLSAVDSQIKEVSDNPSIGLLLCKTKDNIEVEFALRDINKPIGISEINFTEVLPDNLKSSLPTIEELENEFKKL